jgi:hypothetical protein
MQRGKLRIRSRPNSIQSGEETRERRRKTDLGVVRTRKERRNRMQEENESFLKEKGKRK